MTETPASPPDGEPACASMLQDDLADLEAFGLANLAGIMVWIVSNFTLDCGLVVFLGFNLAAFTACAARRTAVGEGAWLIDAAVIIAFDLPGMAVWFVMSAHWEPGVVLAFGLNAAAYVMCRAIHQRIALRLAASAPDTATAGQN